MEMEKNGYVGVGLGLGVGVGLGLGVGVGVGEGYINNSLYVELDKVDASVIRIIHDYKPFLDPTYHFVFQLFPSNHIPFVHFLIFLIWFASPFHFPIQLFDLFSLFLYFHNFPFHSCLFHIKHPL